ncbi:MAG: DUF3179 domain-containing protein [Cytophagales bacterium]|nr:DUF3179 domain-containing protein [Cytophagales bacterium]
MKKAGRINGMVLALGLMAISACEDEVESNREWAIPATAVFDGGPGKDGIPSIDSPSFGDIASQDNNIPDGDLVVVVKVGDEVKAYAHNILDWHEIVNDDFTTGLKLALTYCPLTGTAIGWDRTINETVTTFGVSGLLYNSNLIPYDRVTDSYWSQMLNESVSGQLINQAIAQYPVSEMTFAAFKEAFPNGRVLTRSTGFNRTYGLYPYGSYLSTNNTLFPVDRSDDRIFAKERVLGVQAGGITRVYQLSLFEETNIVLDNLDGQDLIIFGNQTQGFANAYLARALNNETLTLESIDGENGVVARDQFGNEWNLFGEAVSGPDAAVSLLPAPGYIGFYFAWVAFNADVEIFEGS